MSSTDPISWSTAKRVAARISGTEPFSNSYLAASIDEDFIRLTRRSEEFIADATGLQADGPAKIRVTDRRGWVDANTALFARILRPLSDKLREKTPPKLGTQITGAQLGLVLGWMSTRVLGQYDLLFERDVHPEEQDFLYYVAPNVLALEKRYAFPPEEFRFWIALHECTHRAQFTGVAWLPQHFKSLTEALLQDVDADSKTLTESLKQVMGARNSPDVDNAGVAALFASPEQRKVIGRIMGLMALLEGHADVTMSRAAGTLIPNAERFHRVMHHRRTNAGGAAKIFQRFLGMEAKLRQYVEGEKFIRAVEASGGRSLFDRVWEHPGNLPDADEIRDPNAWISRMAHVPA